jgi:hypothetical protein
MEVEAGDVGEHLPMFRWNPYSPHPPIDSMPLRKLRRGYRVGRFLSEMAVKV